MGLGTAEMEGLARETAAQGALHVRPGSKGREAVSVCTALHGVFDVLEYKGTVGSRVPRPVTGTGTVPSTAGEDRAVAPRSTSDLSLP